MHFVRVMLAEIENTWRIFRNLFCPLETGTRLMSVIRDIGLQRHGIKNEIDDSEIYGFGTVEIESFSFLRLKCLLLVIFSDHL